jgi:hypothetical protein
MEQKFKFFYFMAALAVVGISTSKYNGDLELIPNSVFWILYISLGILMIAFPFILEQKKNNENSHSNNMSKGIQIVAPTLGNDGKYPAIKRSPHGRTIGYINFGEETSYIQIIATTKLEDHSEWLTIVPINKWDDETISRIKEQMTKFIVEIYYLDKAIVIAEHVSFELDEGFQQNVMQINLSGN